jgi:homoserine dehydrogenase
VARRIRIGLIGCGVVGTGVLRILTENAASIRSRIGADVEVRHVVVGDAQKARDAVVPADLVTDDAEKLFADPEVDLVVEVMGGTGRASELVRRALELGKHVVTANKALIAEQGDEILALAEKKGVDLVYEAAVAGGIPIMRVLREAFASDRILRIHGIVNGTSNYILTRMAKGGADFAEALAEAQAKGYAEADPTLDVNGGDACHKLALLANLAFGTRIRPDQISTEGIDMVSALDMKFAARFGYAIRSLAIADRLPGDRLDLRVHPALVPKNADLAGIHGATNAVHLEGATVGPAMLSGLGAGAGPTAVSVVSDVIDVARNVLHGSAGRVPPLAIPRAEVRDLPVQPIGELSTEYYLRFSVRDLPGVLAKLAGVLAAHDVSIEQLVQERKRNGAEASIVLTTHHALEKNVRAALAEIAALPDMTAKPVALRIVA